MSDVRPNQVWDVYSNHDDRWRPVRVLNVLSDEVELQYLDMPGVSDLARTMRVSRAHMLHNQTAYRLVTDVP